MGARCAECFRRDNAEFYETHATKAELMKIYGVKRVTIEKWQKHYRETFPEPIRGMSLGVRGKGAEVYYNKKKVEAFLLARESLNRARSAPRLTRVRKGL